MKGKKRRFIWIKKAILFVVLVLIVSGFYGCAGDRVNNRVIIYRLDAQKIVSEHNLDGATIQVEFHKNTNTYSVTVDTQYFNMTNKEIFDLLVDLKGIKQGDDSVFSSVDRNYDCYFIDGLTLDLVNNGRFVYSPNNESSNSSDSTSNSSDNYETSTVNFTNKFGNSTTVCAYPGCDNYIASSGDTNCCTVHSNRCAECGTYIDYDAYACMKCLTGN